MNGYIKNIVLFSKDGKKREVPLDDGLNIITGDSKTGKSALIEIVDYCLFASRSTVPVGKITEYTVLFCIIIKTEENYLVIARPHWKSDKRTKAFFSIETNDDFMKSFSYEYFSNKTLRNLKAVQQDVEQYLGLSVTDTRSSSDDDKRNAGKATMRSFVSLLFQHQNLIANKHSLFYRFDDFQKRKKTVEQLPILLGWVDGEYYRLKQELDFKKKELSREKKRLSATKLTKDQECERLKIPIKQYYSAIGYVLEEELTLQELKRIAKKLPEIPQSSYEDSNIDAQLIALKDKRTKYRMELSEVLELIDQVSNNSADASDFRNSLNQIITANNVDDAKKDLVCPVCHSKTPRVESVINEIQMSREHLISELHSVGSYKKDSSNHIAQLIEKRDSFKKRVRLITSEITNLEKSSKKDNSNRDLREKLMHLKGRIEVTLEQILGRPTLSQNSINMDELKDSISIITEKLNGYDLKAKIAKANCFLNDRMTKISEKLDFEKELQPGEMRFDLETFDFYYKYKKDTIRLSEMGSGANWLACHLSLFLSLLHLCCKESQSCIPSFLFIDQPSQVYFPKATKVISKEEGDSDVFDENIIQVKNIFKIILDEIETIKKDCGFLPQVVVMEHADEEDFNQYVKKRWASKGDKLI